MEDAHLFAVLHAALVDRPDAALPPVGRVTLLVSAAGPRDVARILQRGDALTVRRDEQVHAPGAEVIPKMGSPDLQEARPSVVSPCEPRDLDVPFVHADPGVVLALQPERDRDVLVQMPLLALFLVPTLGQN